MIKTEIVTINGQQFEHVYSDENCQVCRDGRAWDEVYNPLNIGRTYTDGDPIPETEATAEELLDILLGGTND